MNFLTNCYLFLAQSGFEPYAEFEQFARKKPHPHHPVVPEPAMYGFLLLSLLLVFYFMRRKPKQ